MRIASKLKDLVAANFIEIRREDEELNGLPVHPAEETTVASEAEAPAAPPPGAPTVAFSAPSVAAPPPARPGMTPEERFPLPGFVRALAEDGTFDMEIILADVPMSTVPMSAEQAIQVLRELPDDATPASRYRAMKEALTADVEGIAPQVVTDAAQKMVLLNRFLTNAQAENAAFRAVIDGEIARLEEQIGELRELMARSSARANATLSSARKRVDHMTGIIAFFDEFQAMYRYEQETGRDAYGEATPAAQVDEDEQPAFLRDDNVYKLLGVSVPPDKKARAA